MEKSLVMIEKDLGIGEEDQSALNVSEMISRSWAGLGVSRVSKREEGN